MIVSGAFQMFGTLVSPANTNALALQDSLAKSVAAANAIDTAVSINPTPAGFGEIAGAASQLAQALGAATSISDLQNQANNLSIAVIDNADALAAKTSEGKSRTADLVAKVETAVHSWENVHDVASLNQAVKDTGAAANSVGGFLAFLGGIFVAIIPALGVPLLVAGGVMLAVGSDTGQDVAGTVSDTVAEIAGLPAGPARTQALEEITKLTDGPAPTDTTGPAPTDTTGPAPTDTTGPAPTDGQTDDHPKDGDNGPPENETTGQPKGQDDGQALDRTDGVGVNTGLIEGIERSQFDGTEADVELGTSLDVGKDLGVPHLGVDIPQPGGNDIIAELSTIYGEAHLLWVPKPASPGRMLCRSRSGPPRVRAPGGQALVRAGVR